MIKCTCINDKNRPKEIPIEKWIVKGNKYHVTFIYNMINQKGILGCTISEISLDDLEPYNCYNLARFAFDEKDLQALIEMMEGCAEFNDFDTNELTRIAERELAILN